MTCETQTTIGVDLGDAYSRFCVLSSCGEITEEGRVATTNAGIRGLFERRERSRVVIEAGAHSPWVSRMIAAHGHEVVVANPRHLTIIYQSHRKNDRNDAQALARVGRLDPKLLAPVHHRSEDAQVDLTLLRARDVLVNSRTKLINHLRGTVKIFGARLPKCSGRSFHWKGTAEIPERLREVLSPLVTALDTIDAQIREYDRKVRVIAETKYPETRLLRQVNGVGALTATAYVLTLEDPARFSKSRKVSAFVGLVPRQDQSGQRDLQMRITKAGNGYIRKLLVQSAHYAMGPFGRDCELRRWGMTLAARGGRSAKKRAVVAVARKLAALLHHLWRTGVVYEPLRSQNANAATIPA
jgi:transposase